MAQTVRRGERAGTSKEREAYRRRPLTFAPTDRLVTGVNSPAAHWRARNNDVGGDGPVVVMGAATVGSGVGVAVGAAEGGVGADVLAVITIFAFTAKAQPGMDP